MKIRPYVTTAAVLVSLLFATVTVSAQESRKAEKKMIIVTEENGDLMAKDSSFSKTDTLIFEDGNLVITTREGKRIIRKPGEGSRMVWVENRGDFGSPAAGPGMRPARAMAHMQEEKEGVIYNISVDGVVVHIRAPKEKAKEADQILSEVKKILMNK